MSARVSYIADLELLMKDAGAITSSAAAQVSGADKTIDVGPGRLAEGTYVDFYVTAVDTADADETYTLAVEGSNDSFSTSVVLAQLPIANGETGQARLGIDNDHFGTVYRELRVYTTVGGTTPSINYTARMTSHI